MKTNTILMTALIAATVGIPAFAAAPAQVQADAVVQTAYNAAQAPHADAAGVFKDAMGQRASWSKADVYNVYNAVLMGSGLNKTFAEDLQSYADGVNQQAPGVRLIAALREVCTKLPAGTFEAVVGQLVGNANGTATFSERVAANQQGVNTNGPISNTCNVTKRTSRSHPAPVTPKPISSQN